MRKRKLLTYGRKNKPDLQRSRQSAGEVFSVSSERSESKSPPPPPKKADLKPGESRVTAPPQPSMTVEPSEDNIQAVLSLGMCDRETAIKYLKAKNNNPEQAVNALFDGEDITQTELANAWDEGAWDADRNGNTTTSEYKNLQPLGTSAAPTRGPSPSGSYRQPGNKREEDADFAAALAASQQDLTHGFGQETGVLRPDGSTAAVYGPQTQDRYRNASQWALVKATPIATETLPDVEPEDRRHVPPAPRFLRNERSGDYLPNFLTICHSIPAARDLLLLSDCIRTDYGSDAEWWRGHKISLPRIVHTSDGSDVNSSTAKYDDLIAEVQRLMAFLDSSDRMYASTSSLEQMNGLGSHGRTATSSLRTILETFIKELVTAVEATCRRGAEVEKLFCSIVGTDSDGDMDTPTLEVFQFDVDITGDKTRGLFELLDEILWETDPDDDVQDDHYIEQLPEVMVMRIKQINAAETRLKVEAPPTLHMDKYLKSNIDVSKTVRQRISMERKRVTKIEELEKRLKRWKHPHNNSTIDAQSLLMHTWAQFVVKAEDEAASEDKDAQSTATEATSEKQLTAAEIAQKLNIVVQGVERRLIALQKEKEKTKKIIAELSNAPPPELVEAGLQHRYTLVGLATKSNITYLLRPKQDTEEEQMLLENEEDETPPGMQWWRIEYSVNGTNASISQTKVAAYEALPAVALEHSSALLVYASDTALDARRVHHHNLPDSLQRFIDADNELFNEELRSRSPPGYSFDMAMDTDRDAPRESIEKRDSLDSTRAEMPESPDMDAFGDPSQHSAFGLGYGMKDDYPDPPVAVIPEPTEDEDSGTEMVETHRSSRMSGLVSDTVMEDTGSHVTQDQHAK